MTNQEHAERLRQVAGGLHNPAASGLFDAADLIEQQAQTITTLRAELQFATRMLSNLTKSPPDAVYRPLVKRTITRLKAALVAVSRPVDAETQP